VVPARLAPVMISTPGHRGSQKAPTWSPASLVAIRANARRSFETILPPLCDLSADGRCAPGGRLGFQSGPYACWCHLWPPPALPITAVRAEPAIVGITIPASATALSATLAASLAATRSGTAFVGPVAITAATLTGVTPIAAAPVLSAPSAVLPLAARAPVAPVVLLTVRRIGGVGWI
jgi:hypothetical protein